MIHNFAELAEKYWAKIFNRICVGISGFYITTNAVADQSGVHATDPSFLAQTMTAGSCIVIMLNIVILAPKAYSRTKRMWYCINGKKPNRRITDIAPPSSPSDIDALK